MQDETAAPETAVETPAEPETPKAEKPKAKADPVEARLKRLELAVAELTRRTEGLGANLGKHPALAAICAEQKATIEAEDEVTDLA